VADGTHVEAGDTVASIEAMKMEHPLVAPIPGVVRIEVAVGDPVRRDQLVARIEERTP
jgi:acetyl-CoA/propionyl-CoA carboxylase biotin carboxyl carrier protein